MLYLTSISAAEDAIYVVSGVSYILFTSLWTIELFAADQSLRQQHMRPIVLQTGVLCKCVGISGNKNPFPYESQISKMTWSEKDDQAKSVSLVTHHEVAASVAADNYSVDGSLEFHILMNLFLERTITLVGLLWYIVVTTQWIQIW